MTFTAPEKLADLFVTIIKESAGKTRKSNKASKDKEQQLTIEDILANKEIASIISTRYTNGILYIGNESIQLPIQLLPEKDINEKEMPFIHALCEVYSEKLEQVIEVDTLDTIPPFYKKHLDNQKRAYFSAESIQRAVRDVFADGEMQFAALKQDAYDGIEMVYSSPVYDSGYARLQAVLEKITNTTLSHSALMQVVGLINNLEKKGICHILVNDEKIKSWVNIDG